MKKWVGIALWIFVGAGLIALLGFVESSQHHRKLNALTVNIDRQDGNYFVLEEEIERTFSNRGYSPGQEVTQIDIIQLEKSINEHPAVRTAEVYTTVKGNLKVEIKQRMPLVRVFNNQGGSFYIDKEGWLMPLSLTYTARVPVANGNISAGYQLYNRFNLMEKHPSMDSIPSFRILKDVFNLAHYIQNDAFLDALISQVYVNEKLELEVIPKVGDHIIVLGNATDLAEKFAKLVVFYKGGLNKTGWNNYSIINLKYKNQVVCKKK